MYIAVLLAAVLYSGGLTLKTVFGIPLVKGIWMIGLIAAAYTVWGGLKAVAWADLFQGGGLLLGGIMIFFLGLHACGGMGEFFPSQCRQTSHGPSFDHPGLPWTGVASGMWIVLVYYCGLNQFIVQRNLAAKTLRDGQLGVIFAAALWLLVPFAIVMPGMMSISTLSRPDENARRGLSASDSESGSDGHEGIYVRRHRRGGDQLAGLHAQFGLHDLSRWIFISG